MLKRDITAQSSQMPRGEALLYKVKEPQPDGHHYHGMTVLPDGRKLFIKLWADCEVKGKQVLHLKFT